MKLTIGLQLAPQHGEMKQMREAWMEAEALGVDRLWTADHFNAQNVTEKDYKEGQIVTLSGGKSFESTAIQAAMAATTSVAEIGCIVHANSYRNPNLMADIARTIDHISGGRFILGIGSGYLRQDYDEYGYEFGTQKSRSLDLARDIPIIRTRFGKLNPPPLRRIQLLIASMGEQIGMRILAEHADMWHVLGTPDKVREKIAVLKRICAEIARNPAEIEITANCMPQILPDDDPDVLHGLGATHLIGFANGPDWDLGQVKELLAWRKALGPH